MAYPFERTLRSLNGYESRTRILLVALVTLGLGGLVAWALLARVPVMKVSSQGRIEPHKRGLPARAARSPVESCRSLLNLDEEVQEGDLLIEFDTRTKRLELDQSKATSAAQDQEARRHSRSDHQQEGRDRPRAARSRSGGPRGAGAGEGARAPAPAGRAARTARPAEPVRFDLGAREARARHRGRFAQVHEPNLFYDTGKVAQRFSDLDLNHLEHDYGFGFRFNTDAGVVMRVDAGFGSSDGNIFTSSSAAASRRATIVLALALGLALGGEHVAEDCRTDVLSGRSDLDRR